MAAAFVFEWRALNLLGIHTIVWALRFFVAWFLKDWVPEHAAAQGKLFLIFGAKLFSCRALHILYLGMFA